MFDACLKSRNVECKPNNENIPHALIDQVKPPMMVFVVL